MYPDLTFIYTNKIILNVNNGFDTQDTFTLFHTMLFTVTPVYGFECTLLPFQSESLTRSISVFLFSNSCRDFVQNDHCPRVLLRLKFPVSVFHLKNTPSQMLACIINRILTTYQECRMNRFFVGGHITRFVNFVFKNIDLGSIFLVRSPIGFLLNTYERRPIIVAPVPRVVGCLYLKCQL